jgi:hypothetical protein
MGERFPLRGVFFKKVKLAEREGDTEAGEE